jgi:diadenosine tetraphosphate (Ap4A) HIT family hydrolase
MFALDKRLATDTEPVADWPLCRVLLMRDANYPWLILVPRRDGARHLHELDAADQSQAMTEISRASAALESLHSPYKINVAALGNVVDQLHIHVIARFKTDPAWPGPVWGVVPALTYGVDHLRETVERLHQVLD